MLYKVFNGPMPTTAAQAKLATGAVIKTMMQLKGAVTIQIREWGISFDGFAAAAPISCELLETNVAATVTAYVDADLSKIGSGEQAAAAAAGITLGTSASGYNASAEGSITAVRMFDAQIVQPTNQYVYQFPLGTEARILIGNFGRIRVTAPATVNCLAYMLIEV